MSSFTRIRRIALFLFASALVTVAGFAGYKQLGAEVQGVIVPTITASMPATIFTDVDGDGRADPGDTLLYTVTINNSGSDATGTKFTDTLDPNTTLVPGSVSASPITTNDTYTATGNVPITQPDGAGDLLGNDINPLTGTNSGLTVQAGTISSTNCTGGCSNNVTLNADGSFTYTSPPGFTGADTFNYNATDGTSITQGTATVTVSNVIWFVNTGAAVNGNGTLNKPFNCLIGAGCFSASSNLQNDVIFVYSGNVNASGGLNLKDGQKLIGQGATDSIVNISGITLAPNSAALPSTGGARPVFTTTGSNAIVLAGNNTIRGITIDTVTIAGRKIFSAGPFFTLTLGNNTSPDVQLSGAGKALDLTNGTFSATSGLISVATTGSGSHGIQLINVHGTIGFGSTTVSGSASQGIFVNASDANINFGNTTVGATGGATECIRLESNTGGTRTFGTVGASGCTSQGITISGSGNTTVTGNATVSSVSTGILANAPGTTTVINFQGPTSVTTTGAGATGVNWSGAAGSPGASLTFNSLGIQTNGGTGLSATVGGTVAVTNGTGAVNGTPQAAAAVSANGVTLNANFLAINCSGSANCVNLTNVSGTSNFGTGSLTGATAATFVVSGGNGSVTYSGTVSQANPQRVVDVQNKTGGTVTFAGPVTATNGGGVFLNANTGATINFSGGMDLSTGANNAFTATAGGTVNATQNNTSIVNTITTTSGQALNVANTTIGASGMTFRSISSGAGANNGITLDTTGAGAFTITGNGTAGSGGTIAGKTGNDGVVTSGIGIYMNAVGGAVSLTRMAIDGCQNYGIRGVTVSGGFSLASSTVGTVTKHGTSVLADTDPTTSISGEGSIRFRNLTGTSSITNSTLDNGFSRTVLIVNDVATPLNLTVTGNTINQSLNNTNGGDPSGGTSDAFMVDGGSSSVMNVSWANTNVTAYRQFGFFARTQNSATQDLSISTSSFSNTNTGSVSGAGSISIGGSGLSGGDVFTRFTIQGNSFRHGTGGSAPTNGGAHIVCGLVSGAGKFDGKILNNTIGVSGIPFTGAGNGGDALRVFTSGNAGSTRVTGTTHSRFLIQGNSIKRWGEAGIQVNARQGNATMDATILGNIINEPGTAAAGAFAAIWANAGALPTDSNVLNLAVGSAGVVGDKNTMQDSDPSNATDVFVDSNSCGACTSQLNVYQNGSDAAGATIEAKVRDILVDDNNPTLDLLAGFTNGSTRMAVLPGLPPQPVIAEPAERSALIPSSSVEPIVVEAISTFGEKAATPEFFAHAEALEQPKASEERKEDPTRSESVLARVMSMISPTAYAQDTKDESTVKTPETPGTKDTAPAAPASGETVTVQGSGSGFTLPGGKSVTITFKAVIDSTQPSVTQVSTQGTVSGTNFANVLTDDPTVAGAANPTVTAVDHTSVVVTSSGSPSVFGQNLTFTATLSGVPTRASDPPGTVQFKADGVAIGSPVPVVVGTVGDNVSTAQASISTLSVGPHVITAEYSGGGAGALSYNANLGTLAGGQAVSKANSSTALASSSNPSFFGQSVTFTATVSAGSPGSGTPTGNVVFLDGATPITGCSSVALVSGVAQCTTSALTVGNHTITTTYAGDTNFNSSNGSLSNNPQVVNKAATTVGVTSSVNPTQFGQSTTFTATITVTAPGAGVPTGTITFRDNAVNIGTCAAQTVTANVATCSISTVSVGTHPITAVYNGDGNFSASPASGVVNQLVNKAGTSLALTSSANPSVANNVVTFTATLTATSPGTGTPQSGTVQFLDGGNPIAGCSAVAVSVSGQATCSTTTLTVGNHTITASYSGDASYNASTGSLTGNPQVVLAAPRSRADFDGDGKTDFSVFRPSTGDWFAQRSTAGFQAIRWGQTGDVLVPGDYDGDGKADFAVWRPTDTPNVTDFYVLNSNGFTITGYSHGLTTDVPVAGDFDGDGKNDIVVWRPSTGFWYIWSSLTQTTTAAQFGQTGDIPMALDKDGVGGANLTVYRPSDRTFYIANATGVPAQNFTSVQWGLAGDVLVPADYDGDNKDDVAVFRPSNGVWYIFKSTGGTSFVQFGASGDVPVAGDYDGDGVDDVAVYRSGTWYVRGSTSGFQAVVFGLSTDTPVPAKYVP